MLPPKRSANPDLQEYIGNYFSEGKYKAGFRAYYYSLLYNRAHPEKELMVGIFGLQEVNKGIQFLRNRETVNGELLREFSRQLTALIEEVFNPDEVFKQTEDFSKCSICPYATICSRN